MVKSTVKRIDRGDSPLDKLTLLERKDIARLLRENRDNDRSADVKFEYLLNRSLESVGGGDAYTQGYNELNGVDFRKVMLELQMEFPQIHLRGLDVGCGHGIAGSQLWKFSKEHPEMLTIEMHGTNAIKRETLLGESNSHIMPAHKLGFENDSFQFVLSVEGPTRHGDRLDLYMEEMYRVTAPGGRIYFHGVPMAKKANLTQTIEDFEQRHGIRIHKKAGNGYAIFKPKTGDTRLLEVPYHWMRFHGDNAGEVREQWVVRETGIAPDELMPMRWWHQQRTRISLHGDVYASTLGDGTKIVYKKSHVGELMVPSSEDEGGLKILRNGYNSPFEMLAICSRLKSMGFQTIEPLAIVAVDNKTELAEHLKDQRKFEWLSQMRNPDGSKALREGLTYYTLWRHVDCVDARNALRTGMIDQKEHDGIVNGQTEILSSAGFELMTDVSDRFLLETEGGQIKRDNGGNPNIILSNFNSIRSLDPIERLSPAERDVVAARIKEMRDLNRNRLLADYETERGIDGHGSGDGYYDGYNQLHGVNFLHEVKDHQRRFPHMDVRILDTSGGTLFATQVKHYFDGHPDEAKVDMTVSALTRKPEHDPDQKVDIAPWERLMRRYGPESYHMVVATETFGQYSGSFEMGLEEAYGLVKPGGTLYWTRIPGVHRLAPERTSQILQKFETNHNAQIVKAEDALGYRVRKPQ